MEDTTERRWLVAAGTAAVIDWGIDFPTLGWKEPDHGTDVEAESSYA